MLIASERVFLDGEFRPATLRVEGERIAEVILDRVSDAPLTGRLVPGFVDVHSHGGGGATFGTTDPSSVRQALAAHRAHGTTTQVASLVTESLDSLHAQVTVLAELVAAGELAGIHLEGPWLAAEYKGAHPLERLLDPTPAAIDALLDAGRGTIRMVTLAPERVGGLDAVERFVAAGVVVALGHTNADHETARAAIARGATGVTHLFNAMAPLHHRRPGPILAFWESDVYLELIFDTIHVDAALAAQTMRAAPDRAVLITDAMAAASASDGHYVLGELDVIVSDGIARLAQGGAIAGSTLTLDKAVRHAVAAGVPLELALTAATSRPAEYLGLPDVGRFDVGAFADAVVLDADLGVEWVMRRGSWL